MSKEEEKALQEKEADMLQKVQMKYQAMKLLTPEERINLMEKETKEFLKEGY